jgi:NADP-dependent 3-hydroxy acid dehydrogenase YdfG
MAKTALVTGGTGGLGTAVAARLLDDDWRVVVPWVVEQELERVQSHDCLHLIQADLSDADAVPAEIAGVIADLLSDDSSPVSGAAIRVYGRA